MPKSPTLNPKPLNLRPKSPEARRDSNFGSRPPSTGFRLKPGQGKNEGRSGPWGRFRFRGLKGFRGFRGFGGLGRLGFRLFRFRGFGFRCFRFRDQVFKL